jgi:hypothetical protein
MPIFTGTSGSRGSTHALAPSNAEGKTSARQTELRWFGFIADGLIADVFSADVFSADVFSADAFSADAFSADGFIADRASV